MDRPLATCYACSATVEHKKYNSFSYWWCPKCKDEPSSVRLQTTRHPKGEKYGYAKGDNDYVLSAPGVYKLVYLDDTIEFYERSAGCNDLILDGSRIRSAKRLTESDLPSRKPVQSLAEAGKGASPAGQGSPSVRPLSNQASSVPGRTSLPVYTDFNNNPGEEHIYKTSKGQYAHYSEYNRQIKLLTEQEARELAPDHFNKPPFLVSGTTCKRVFTCSKEQVQNIPRSDTSIQQWELPHAFSKSLWGSVDASILKAYRESRPPDDEL